MWILEGIYIYICTVYIHTVTRARGALLLLLRNLKLPGPSLTNPDKVFELIVIDVVPARGGHVQGCNLGPGEMYSSGGRRLLPKHIRYRPHRMCVSGVDSRRLMAAFTRDPRTETTAIVR